jgi:hypothetical protein
LYTVVKKKRSHFSFMQSIGSISKRTTHGECSLVLRARAAAAIQSTVHEVHCRREEVLRASLCLSCAYEKLLPFILLLDPNKTIRPERNGNIIIDV